MDGRQLNYCVYLGQTMAWPYACAQMMNHLLRFIGASPPPKPYQSHGQPTLAPPRGNTKGFGLINFLIASYLNLKKKLWTVDYGLNKYINRPLPESHKKNMDRRLWTHKLLNCPLPEPQEKNMDRRLWTHKLYYCPLPEPQEKNHGPSTVD